MDDEQYYSESDNDDLICPTHGYPWLDICEYSEEQVCELCDDVVKCQICGKDVYVDDEDNHAEQALEEFLDAQNKVIEIFTELLIQRRVPDGCIATIISFYKRESLE
jgi:hypothetical protein